MPGQGQGQAPGELQRSLNRLADDLQDAEARRQMSADPEAFLRARDLQGLPAGAAAALSSLTPAELELFARVQAKLAQGATGESSSPQVAIIF